MIAGHLKVQRRGGTPCCWAACPGSTPYSDEFASRHAWTTPHDAYSAYPASEVILHALAIYVDIFGIPAAGLAPSIPSRRTMRENTMKRSMEEEINVSMNRGIESP